MSTIPSKPTGSNAANTFSDLATEKRINCAIKLKQTTHHRVRVLAAARNVPIAKFVEQVIDELVTDEKFNQINLADFTNR